MVMVKCEMKVCCLHQKACFPFRFFWLQVNSSRLLQNYISLAQTVMCKMALICVSCVFEMQSKFVLTYMAELFPQDTVVGRSIIRGWDILIYSWLYTLKIIDFNLSSYTAVPQNMFQYFCRHHYFIQKFHTVVYQQPYPKSETKEQLIV